MNLLGSVFYDPTGAAAVSKATTALLAMTALDTANLRVTFTGPLSGKVKVVISGGALHGAATYPAILLGVMSGATVVARIAPNVTVCGAASATTPASLYAEFVVSVTPGAATTWDLAYGVEALVASTGLKYGGPNNNTTAGDAFGGISFSVWDAAPTYLPAAMPTSTVQAQAVANGAKLPAALVGGRMDASVGAMAADVITAAATAADFGTEVGTAVWAATTRLLTAGTNIVLAKGTGVTGLNDLDAAGVRGAVGLASANLDTQLTTIDDFLDTEVAAIKTKTDFLPSVTPGAAGGLFIAGSNAATTVNFTGNLSGSVGSVTGAVGSVTGNVGGNVVGSVGSVTGLTVANLDVAVSTRASAANLSTVAGYIDTEVASIKGVVDKLDTAMELDGAVYRFTLNALELAPTGGGGGGLDAAGVRAAIGLASASLDTQLAAIDSKTTNLPSDPADQSLLMAAIGGLATPDNAGIAAIKAKTDQLVFTVANKVDSNIEAVNGAAIIGSGTLADPWGPTP